jgi:ABC-type ATPase involved in cell division
MRFEVRNLNELDQFIKDNNVNIEKSKLETVLESFKNGTHQIDDFNLALRNGIMIFLVCNDENNNTTMKNFIIKVKETK